MRLYYLKKHNLIQQPAEKMTKDIGGDKEQKSWVMFNFRW